MKANTNTATVKAVNPVRYNAEWDSSLYARKEVIVPQTHISNGHKLIKLGR